MFGAAGTIKSELRDFVFRYRSAQHCGPVVKAFEALDTTKEQLPRDDLLALLPRSIAPATASW